jgi:hypothetical protein
MAGEYNVMAQKGMYLVILKKIIHLMKSKPSAKDEKLTNAKSSRYNAELPRNTEKEVVTQDHDEVTKAGCP